MESQRPLVLPSFQLKDSVTQAWEKEGDTPRALGWNWEQPAAMEG